MAMEFFTAMEFLHGNGVLDFFQDSLVSGSTISDNNTSEPEHANN